MKVIVVGAGLTRARVLIERGHEADAVVVATQASEAGRLTGEKAAEGVMRV